MSFLPPIKRFALEDFASQKSWINMLLNPLNRFFQNVYNNLNHNITFKDNMQAMVVELIVDQTYPLKFISTLRVKPRGVWIVNIVEIADSPATITNAVTLDWEYDGEGNIKINNIAGLTASKRYTLSLIVIGG